MEADLFCNQPQADVLRPAVSDISVLASFRSHRGHHLVGRDQPPPRHAGCEARAKVQLKLIGWIILSPSFPTQAACLIINIAAFIILIR